MYQPIIIRLVQVTWETLKQEMITEKQSFDFFCKQWPNLPKVADKDKAKRMSMGVMEDDADRRQSQELVRISDT